MNAQSIIKGLQLLEESKPSTVASQEVKSENGCIYAGNSQYVLTKDQQISLYSIGWSWDHEKERWYFFA